MKRPGVSKGVIGAAIFFFFLSASIKAQVVYHSLDHKELYDFLDELATQKVITLNTAVKPYSRKLIAEKLLDARASGKKMNRRQCSELDFYLQDFRKEISTSTDSLRLDLVYRRDSNFSLTLNPVFGATLWRPGEDQFYHRKGGAELQGFVENLGIRFRLIDNHESQQVSGGKLLTQRKGAMYKSSSTDGADFSDMQGGMGYSWKWGAIGLYREEMVWGNNYNGANIFTNRAPTFTRIHFSIKPKRWLELNYTHGYLVSGVLDSNRAYNAGVHVRNIFVKKFLAANMLTVTPMKGLSISGGNSMVYSDYANPGFFIPFMFFKSIDHQSYYGGGNFGGQNAQMFLDISSRQIKNVHLYGTLFIDEISFSRMWDKTSHSNFYSLKAGVRFNNIMNSDVSIIGEYTRTNPIVYRHFVNTTTFESNGFGLGHYLGDNSSELYTALLYKPLPRLFTRLSYTMAKKGPLYPYTGTNRTGLGLPFLASTDWSLGQWNVDVSYEIINDLLLYFKVNSSDIYVNPSFDPGYTSLEVQQGLTISLGFTVGF